MTCCEARLESVPASSPPHDVPFACLAAEELPGDSMMVMASNDLASVVISARRREEMSHMTVFSVVLLQASIGGIVMMPWGMGMELSEGATKSKIRT
ncbi:hypothetical protein HYQ46_004089 [Verticillium longisporum]|nr:hypothetical protein HYQ46_004089 [Verticillium longisporum]